MTYKSITQAVILGTTSSLLIAGSAIAGGTENCQTLYGGYQTCVQQGNLVLNKTVLNPATNTYVDNLGMQDARYSAGQTVTFHISLTNTGKTTLSKINVKDVMPQFVKLTSNDTFEVVNLAGNESRTLTVTGKINDAKDLPAQAVSCVINKAQATIDGKTIEDNATFCIEKTTNGGLKVFPQPEVKKTPATGPEMLALVGLIPSGIAGYFLRKKSKLS